MIYGYARVSTKGQAKNGNSLEEQKEVILSRYPTAKIVSEASSGAKYRTVFSELVQQLQRGDVLVVTKLDRFCRTTKEGLQYIDELMAKGVSIHILNMGLIEDTAMGRLIVTNLLAFAEFERAMIVERTQSGKEIAKQNPNYREGRKPKKYNVKKFAELYEKVCDGYKTVAEAANELGISRAKWYRITNDI
ncbi:MAG: Transposon Tn3 resolvase [Firmicutes bacterium ADurb.Bin193]|nr:MAG: Transposon Tn3 resolvase [Firmicutes bacterium ADurb.Bin193]